MILNIHKKRAKRAGWNINRNMPVCHFAQADKLDFPTYESWLNSGFFFCLGRLSLEDGCEYLSENTWITWNASCWNQDFQQIWTSLLEHIILLPSANFMIYATDKIDNGWIYEVICVEQ